MHFSTKAAAYVLVTAIILGYLGFARHMPAEIITNIVLYGVL